MKNLKKILSLLLVFLMLFAVVAGCGASENEEAQEPEDSEQEESVADKSEITIGVCMGSINHPVHRIVQMGFLETSDNLGYRGIVSGLDEGSLQELLTKWESAITNGMSGALIWAGDDSCYSFMRDNTELCKFVVPHFAHTYEDTKTFISRNICCLAADYGKSAAEYVLEQLAAKGVTEGTIGLTQSGPNVTENAAADAFRETINNSGTAFKVADTVFEGVEVVEATNKVSAVIQSNPDIVGGFGTTGASAQSWAAAMTNTGKTDLVVVGVDYVELNLNLVEEGAISAVVAQPLYDEAKISAETLDALFNGEDFSGSEEDWRVTLEAPLATTDGDLSEYRDIVSRVKDYFND